MHVVLQPHSNTNSSSKYRVVDSAKWNAHTSGLLPVLPVAAEYDTYEAAELERDRLNELEANSEES